MADIWDFENEEIKVTWEKNTCIHSGMCMRTNPGVFKPGQKPWVQLEGADAEAVKEAIGKCPSAALKFQLKT